jgi:hypothetical protein
MRTLLILLLLCPLAGCLAFDDYCFNDVGTCSGPMTAAPRLAGTAEPPTIMPARGTAEPPTVVPAGGSAPMQTREPPR